VNVPESLKWLTVGFPASALAAIAVRPAATIKPVTNGSLELDAPPELRLSAVPERLAVQTGEEMRFRLGLAVVAGLVTTALLVPASQGTVTPYNAAGLVPSRLGSQDPRDTPASER
jgi:hypothetical protein